jgi:iron complex outermembrane receptor protein
MPRILFLLLCLCSTLALVAQGPDTTYVLSGVVIDDHDGTPLSFAEIHLPVQQRGVVADAEGRFRLEGLSAGTYLVRVLHLGCEPVERRVVVTKDVQVEFHLEHHAEELHELEVIAKRPDENVGMSRNVTDKEAMENSSGRTMAEMIASIPGVNMVSSGPTIGKPMIHGLYGNRVLLLNQGIRQEDQQWGTEHAPNLDPFSSDRITVVKGAASVQYGADAIGGVVITEPVELPRSAGIGGELRTVGLLNGRGGGVNGLLQGGSGHLRGLGWRVQGSMRRLGDSEAPDYVLSNTGLREAGISASLGLQRQWGAASVYYSWFHRELGILRASHIGNLTDLQNAIEQGEPWYQAPFTYSIAAPRQTVAHHLLKTEAMFRLSERDQLVLTYGYQADDRQEFDVRRGGRSDVPSIDLFLTTHTGDAVLKHWLGRKLHGKVGVSGIYQDNYNIPGTGIRPLIPDHVKQSVGVFVLEHYPLSKKVELEAGARLEGTLLQVSKFDAEDVLITPEHRFVNHAVSVGANWGVKEGLRVRANLSTAFRPPHVSELYSEGLHHGSAAIEEGDPTLLSEKAFRGSVDVEGSWFKDRLTTELTLHGGTIDNYIYLRPSGYRLTIRGAFPVFDYVATDATLYGTDMTLTYAIQGPWSVRSRFTLVRGWDRTLQDHLFLMPADRWENAVLYEQDSVGTWNGLQAALTSTWVAEQLRVPLGVDFTDPPPAYHLLGASLSMSRPVGSSEMRFGVLASNLLNVAYRDYLDRFRYYADARGVDVSLWLRFSFGNTRSRR